MTEPQLPDPQEAAPGVWTIPVPFPNPLGHMYCYAVELDDGVAVIDAGWDSERSWSAFLDGLAAGGAGLADIRAVLVTHIHPDHYGLAGRLRAHTDAWIAMHGDEAARIPRSEAEVDQAIEEIVGWLQQVGAPRSEVELLRDDAPRIKAKMSMEQPDLLLEDGEPVPGCEELVAIHTPGHTPGHLCFHSLTRGVVFTGDHLLPRITPNVSKRPQMGEDPLGDFVRSVTKLRGLGTSLGLPGHEWSIEDVDGRIDVLADHHQARMTDVESAVRAGASTVWDVARAVRWSRPWEDLQGLARRSAIGETHAHLERLVRERRLEHREGAPDRWAPLDGQADAAR